MQTHLQLSGSRGASLVTATCEVHDGETLALVHRESRRSTSAVRRNPFPPTCKSRGKQRELEGASTGLVARESAACNGS